MIGRLLFLLPIMLYAETGMLSRDSMTTFKLLITYTFLTPREGGLAVSYDPRIDNDSSLTSPTTDPQSGVRIGAAYLLDNNLDITFSYAWFCNMNNIYEIAPLPMASDMNSLYSTWALSLLSEIDNSKERQFVDGLSSSVWNNIFNRIDLSLGRSFCISRCLTLRPFLGLLFAWDEQDYIVSYGYIGDSNNSIDWSTLQKDASNGTMEPRVTEWINRQEWYGIGPYVGLLPTFILWSSRDHSLSISSGGGAALTWSRADASLAMYSGSALLLIDRDLFFEYSDGFLYISPMIEVSLGLSWESIFYEHYSIRGYIGWSQEAWLEHNRIFGLNNYPPSGGIYSMQGLNISIGAGF